MEFKRRINESKNYTATQTLSQIRELSNADLDNILKIDSPPPPGSATSKTKVTKNHRSANKQFKATNEKKNRNAAKKIFSTMAPSGEEVNSFSCSENTITNKNNNNNSINGNNNKSTVSMSWSQISQLSNNSSCLMIPETVGNLSNSYLLNDDEFPPMTRALSKSAKKRQHAITASASQNRTEIEDKSAALSTPNKAIMIPNNVHSKSSSQFQRGFRYTQSKEQSTASALISHNMFNVQNQQEQKQKDDVINSTQKQLQSNLTQSQNEEHQRNHLPSVLDDSGQLQSARSKVNKINNVHRVKPFPQSMSKAEKSQRTQPTEFPKLRNIDFNIEGGDVDSAIDSVIYLDETHDSRKQNSVDRCNNNDIGLKRSGTEVNCGTIPKVLRSYAELGERSPIADDYHPQRKANYDTADRLTLTASPSSTSSIIERTTQNKLVCGNQSNENHVTQVSLAPQPLLPTLQRSMQPTSEPPPLLPMAPVQPVQQQMRYHNFTASHQPLHHQKPLPVFTTIAQNTVLQVNQITAQQIPLCRPVFFSRTQENMSSNRLVQIPQSVTELSLAHRPHTITTSAMMIGTPPPTVLNTISSPTTSQMPLSLLTSPTISLLYNNAPQPMQYYAALIPQKRHNQENIDQNHTQKQSLQIQPLQQNHLSQLLNNSQEKQHLAPRSNHKNSSHQQNFSQQLNYPQQSLQPRMIYPQQQSPQTSKYQPVILQQQTTNQHNNQPYYSEQQMPQQHNHTFSQSKYPHNLLPKNPQTYSSDRPLLQAQQQRPQTLQQSHPQEQQQAGQSDQQEHQLSTTQSADGGTRTSGELRPNCRSYHAPIGSSFCADTSLVPRSIKDLYDLVRKNYSDYSFVYALSAQLCQDRVPMDSYVYFKMSLLLSLVSLEPNDNRPPISLCVICYDTFISNYLMRTVGQLAPRYVGPYEELRLRPKSKAAHHNWIEADPILIAKGGVHYAGDWTRIKPARADKLEKVIENAQVFSERTTRYYPLETTIWTHWCPEDVNENMELDTFDKFFKLFGLPIYMDDDINEVLINYMLHQHRIQIFRPSPDFLTIPIEDLRKFIFVVAQRRVEYSSDASTLLQKYFVVSRIERPTVMKQQTLVMLKQFAESFAKLSLRHEVLVIDVISAIFLCENFIQNIYGPSENIPPPFHAFTFIASIDVHMTKFQDWLEKYIDKHYDTKQNKK